MSDEARRADIARVTAVVLAGGLGTRLRDVVADRPKVLAEFHGRPFLAYVLDALADAGIPRAVIATGYLGAMVREALGDRHGAMEVVYSEEPTPLGTGGAIRLAWARCSGETALVLNGDSLCEASLMGLLDRHAAVVAAGTLLLTRVEDSSRYGSVALDEHGAVTRFEEKRAGGAPAWINAGVYAFSAALIESIPVATHVSLERDVLPAWVGRGLYGFAGSGRFLDIGVPADHARAADFLTAWNAR